MDSSRIQFARLILNTAYDSLNALINYTIFHRNLNENFHENSIVMHFGYLYFRTCANSAQVQVLLNSSK
jgi:hypothetical protein